MDYTEKRMARLRGVKRSKMIVALICAAVGIILLAWPQITMELVCRVVGLALLADGIITLLLALLRRKASFMAPFLAAGIIITLVGLWIFLRPVMLIQLLPRIIGIIIVIDGVMNLLECITSMRQKVGKPLAPILMALVTIGLGALLIVQALGVANTIIRVLGIIFLYNGISDALIASRIRTKAPDEKLPKKDQ